MKREIKNKETDNPAADNTDLRVQAFIRDYRYCENLSEAEEFFTLNVLRRMMSAYASDKFDPLIRLLKQLDENGFFIHHNEINQQGIPVCRKRSFLCLNIKTETDDE
ncbi:MAG: hypothetical protein LUE98_04510 [Tannerellaceae bacterium]|nr:hypothetical protein [Tannerellaceae bacterium]